MTYGFFQNRPSGCRILLRVMGSGEAEMLYFSGKAQLLGLLDLVGDVSGLASFLLRIFLLLKPSGCVRVGSLGGLIGRAGEKVNF